MYRVNKLSIYSHGRTEARMHARTASKLNAFDTVPTMTEEYY